MRRLAVFPIGFALVTGCTLLTDLDGLSSGGSGEPSSPGGDASDGERDSSGMPSRDVDQPDGGTTSGPFCESVRDTDICFDYDSKSHAPQLRMRNATLGVSSPGNDSELSLLCAGVSGAGDMECYHAAAVSPNPKRLRYAFDVLPDPNGQSAELSELRFFYPTGSCAFQPSIWESKLQVNEYCEGQGEPKQINHEVSPLEARDAWYRFDIAIDLVAKTLSGTIDKPSGPVAIGPFPIDPRFVTSPNVELRTGMVYAPRSSPAPSVRTDNVTLDVLE